LVWFAFKVWELALGMFNEIRVGGLGGDGVLALVGLRFTGVTRGDNILCTGWPRVKAL
jgi:hypothetical protein